MKSEDMTEAFAAEGIMENSDQFNGMDSKEALASIIKYIDEKGIGEKKSKL